MKRLEDIIKILSDWQDKTFPAQTAIMKSKHLQEEAKELTDALESGESGSIHEEMADVFMLLLAICLKENVSLEDLVNSLEGKLYHNMNEREWSAPNKDGICHHKTN